MPKTAQVNCTQLHHGLVNLPPALNAAIASKDLAPQSLLVALSTSSSSTSTPSSTTTLYLGLSGLPSSTPTTLDIDRAYASALNLPDRSTVQVDLLSRAPVASRVHITPQTPDDWDLIELHAADVESTLLSQVRAVARGQPLCIWADHQHMVRFVTDRVQVVAGQSGKEEEEEELQGPARLDRDSEVVVAPKLRFKPRESQVQRGQLDASAWFAESLFRLLPLSLLNEEEHQQQRMVWVHPSVLSRFEQAFGLTCAVRLYPRPSSTSSTSAGKKSKRSIEPSESGQGAQVGGLGCKTSWDVPPGHVWLSAGLRAGLGSKEAYDMVQLVPSSSTNAETPKENARHVDGASEPLIGLVGAQKHLDACLRIIRRRLNSWLPNQTSSGMLLTGASGSGKSVLAERIAHEARHDPSILAYVYSVDCSKYTDERPASLKALFQAWFDDAAFHSPSILVLDNIDRMLPPELEHIDTFRAQLFSSLFVEAAQRAVCSRPVFVLALAAGQDAVHKSLMGSHVLGESYHLLPPGKQERKHFFESFLDKLSKRAHGLEVAHLDYTTLATETEGYLPADIQDLVNQAVQSVLASKQPHQLTMDSFHAALSTFVPLSLRDVKLQKSEVQWSDIGGLKEVRSVLRETLEFPTKYAAIFANCPLRLRSGLLLYGYPGCGKTLLASAAAKECGLNFISVKGPELLNKYIGSSEKSVRELFERAQAAKPCVLFFDEFDSIAPRRGHDSTGVTDRVVNQMLTQMDGAEGLDGVYVLAATSRPDLIDPALLRPGRLDKSLLCDMPSEDDRRDILEACSGKLDLGKDVNCAFLAQRTEGFSGADLQSFVYNAHLDAVHEILEQTPDLSNEVEDGAPEMRYVSTSVPDNDLSAAGQREAANRLSTIMKNSSQSKQKNSTRSVLSPVNGTVEAKPKPVVSENHFERALRTARPSVPKNELARLRRIYHEFVAGRSSDGLPSGEASQELGGRVTLG